MAGLRYLLIFIGVMVLSVTSGYAQKSSAELQKDRERLDREIRQLEETLKLTAGDRTLSLRQLNALNAQLKLREQKIATINSEIRIINNQISSNTKAINGLREELTRLRKDYERMVIFAFRNRNAYNKMMFIFASEDFNQAFKRVKYLQQLNDSRKQKANEIEATQQEIEEKVAQLEAARKEQTALLAEAQAERKAVAAEQGEESRVLKTLTQQEKSIQQEISKREQELRRLAAAIDQAIKRELEEQRRIAEEARLAAAKREAERTGRPLEEIEAETRAERKTDAELLAATPEAARLSAEFADNKGRLPWPVKNGVVTLGFGRHTVGRGATQENFGIRVRTHDSMPVTAVFNGEVRVVSPMPGLGYVVLIKHGHFFTLYGNLRSLSVKAGDQVQTGQQLGVAITDSEGLTEVYFEVSDVTTRQNPEQWLAR